MTEPDEDLRTTPADVTGNLAAMVDAGIVRGVMIFIIRDNGEGYHTMGGWISEEEVRKSIRVLETLLLNGVKVSQLYGMDVEGHG